MNIKTYDLTLLYLRNLNFNINNPIQALINYENNSIEKVYWVDGINQMRFLNIRQSVENGANDELIDIESSLINVVGNFKFTTEDFFTMGKIFRKLSLPTVIVQEGGYCTDELGKNVVSFLEAFK